ncbi:transporter substrate-binding domain-containing protein [Nocardioides sp. B-3]|uniref:transporter substrate-binding domain-containing protein n=1 Tax=Nocardioides sp. B-3 TaxID=2895565 RepID=UPI002152A439|nr:transporter substrate-binding domain-containing protein [Nocardioides sp. B-3]UUZ59704.1 transporter substrate-binding domain-containing protein [Nocardioides sp. B-3]
MKLSRVTTSLAAAAVLFSAAACGGESLDNAGAKADPSASTTIDASQLDEAPAEDKAASVINAIAPDDNLAAAVPAEVRERGLRMTTSEGYPPMEMFGSDGKTLIGLDPSLGRAIARKLGLPVTIANEDFNAQIPGVVSDRYDVILSSMTDNAERQAQVTFVDYVAAGAGFIVRSGNPDGIATPADMCGQTVSVVDNGSSLGLPEAYDAECTDAGEDAIDILKFPGDRKRCFRSATGAPRAQHHRLRRGGNQGGRSQAGDRRAADRRHRVAPGHRPRPRGRGADRRRPGSARRPHRQR